MAETVRLLGSPPGARRAPSAPVAARAPLRVAIIGGGVSGLACALTLQRAGVAVTIFEARHRLGGRVWSVRFDAAGAGAGGMEVDMGAMFVCGVDPEREEIVGFVWAGIAAKVPPKPAATLSRMERLTGRKS